MMSSLRVTDSARGSTTGAAVKATNVSQNVKHTLTITTVPLGWLRLLAWPLPRLVSEPRGPGPPTTAIDDNPVLAQWLRTPKICGYRKKFLGNLSGQPRVVFERSLVTALDRRWPSDCTLLCGNPAEFWKLVELAHPRRSHLCLTTVEYIF